MSNSRLELPKGWEQTRLDLVAEIASGVTKGRRFNGATTTMIPYLRVANVQAGHLNLEEVKEIEVLPGDIEKYRLQAGDVLMTEGGDRDKLGRGTIWRDEIACCIHQNHVFRVRPNRDRLLPEYLGLYLGTPDAKSYFLRAAKQTTGIASINMTQLSAFPVVLPPLPEQRRIAAILDKADCIRRKRGEGTGDGCDLVHDAFGQKFGDPLLAINPFKTETQRGEQNGFMNLLKGLYGTIRNPLAHDPKVEWDMTERDALDILTMISLVHRKLDHAYRLRP